MALDLKKIRQIPLSENQYVREETPKKQITLHHTAGNASGVGTISMWDTDDRGRIATCVTISGPGAKGTYDGEICQAFSSKYWAYHLGIKPEVFKAYKVSYQRLDKIAIGVEICNWGPISFRDGKYYTYVNREIPESQVTKLDKPYKGHLFYHKYSDAQIQAVKDLLVYWKGIYNIDLTYNYDQMFTVNTKALKGENGLYSHNSYRKDKTDIYPCPRMIAMLKTL
jgi:hypothetical protein